jgi:hypothetical protein
MEMVSTWWFLLVLLVGGPAVHDMASLLEPAPYLKAHEVELKAERLAELASRQAKGGKEQMIQLMAIRWLGLHPAEAKKADGVLRTLEDIAGEKKGRDANGFASAYARIALARIEGHPISVAPMPRPGYLRSDALAWFPAEATIFGAQDHRASGEISALDQEAVSHLLGRIVPEREWRPIYEFVDAVGNLEIDRIAFALELDEKGMDPKRIWLRFTGAGDPQLLQDFIAKLYPERQERKGSAGEPIVILTKKDRAPAFAFVGKTDLLIAGTKNEQDNHVELISAMLDARAGKIKNVTAGPFAEILKKVENNARGLLVADVPEGLRAELGRSLPAAPIPRRVIVQTTRGKALAVRLEAMMKDADEAVAAAKILEDWKAQGLRALKALPPEVKVPKPLVDVGRQALEGVKLEAMGSAVTVSTQVPSEAIRGVLKALEELTGDKLKEP